MAIFPDDIGSQHVSEPLAGWSGEAAPHAQLSRVAGTRCVR